MDLGLKGKRAIVTGGSSGIGAGISKILAQEGVNIVVASFAIDDKGIKFVEDLQNEYGVEAEIDFCDVSKEENVNALFEKLKSENKYVDILVNNAAGGAPQGVDFDELTLDQWEKAMNGCLLPTFLGSRAFIRQCLEAGKKGNIVNVSAKVAFQSNSFQKIPYATAKGGVATMTKKLAHDYIEKGITVNSIVPGYVLSGFYDASKDDLDALAKEKGLRIGWALPEDMGNIVAFLCSEKSRQIIGVNIDCSGGTML